MKPLDRLLAEVEGRPIPKQDLRAMGVPLRDPVSVEETMQALDKLGMWEDLNLLMCGCSYNADTLERGAVRFREILMAGIGLDVAPMRQKEQ